MENEAFYSTPSLICYGLMAFALLLSVCIHFILYRKEIKIKNFTSSTLAKGLLALAITFMLNGLSSIETYNVSNFAFGLLIVLSLILPYFLFSINLEINKDTKKYLIYVLILASVVIIAEFLWLYLNENVIQGGAIQKSTLDLGWGVSNNIGAVLAMFIPIYFYCAGSSKHTVLFYLGGVLSYACVLLTLSRAAILFSTPIFISCVLFLCSCKHKQRKQSIILTSVLLVAAIIVCICFHDTLYSAFSHMLRAGFNDSGRFAYYKAGIKKFLKDPTFGVGFGNSHGYNTSFVIVAPNYFHNSVIQILASCGVVGFAAYSYHRIETIKLFANNSNTPLAFYIAMSLLALLLTSLLDVHFFLIYPAIIYSTMLCIFERHTLFEKENELNK